MSAIAALRPPAEIDLVAQGVLDPHTPFTLREPEEIRFFEVLRSTGSIVRASEAAGISPQVARYRRQTDESWALAWHHSLADARDLLRAEARHRAMVGHEEPVFYQGEVCGHVRKPSDSLMREFLRAEFPEQFRDRHEVSGPGGGPIEVDSRQIARSVAYALSIASLEQDENST
jgi:hypothetical protein